MGFVLSIDFYRDWESEVKSRLGALGLAYDDACSGDENALTLLQNTRGDFEPRKRKCLFSSEFRCPPAISRALALLKDTMQQGEDLQPYMCHQENHVINVDNRLAAWDLFYLHTGEAFKSEGCVAGASHVAVCVLLDNYVHFLQIIRCDELKGANADLNQRLEALLRDQWLALFVPWRADKGGSVFIMQDRGKAPSKLGGYSADEAAYFALPEEAIVDANSVAAGIRLALLKHNIGCFARNFSADLRLGDQSPRLKMQFGPNFEIMVVDTWSGKPLS